jgi:hypothetical protein
MIYCHKCGTPIREGAKFCTRCGTQLLPPKTEPPREVSGYVSVFQHPPPAAEQDRPYAPPPGARPEPYYPFVPASQPGAMIGAERDIAVSVILTIVTCGIYGLVWVYRIGSDLRNSLGGDDPKPGVDLLLFIFTCGLWGIYLSYKYPSLINDLKRRARLPKSDLPIATLVLSIFGLGLISLALVQNDLNKVWRALRGGGY